MHVLYRSLFLVVCFLFVSYLSNVFSFLLQPVFFYLSACLCWVVVHFELALKQVTWGIRFYPNKGSLGHLLQHENSSTGLYKRRLIDLKPSGLLQLYFSFSWSIFLTTYRYMSIYLGLSRLISLICLICLIYPEVLLVKVENESQKIL